MDITSIKKDYFEDTDYQDSKTEVRSSTTKSKVFQCTGYGDCDMVFTRSEHLARHMRKHTGEKPFQCIVPGCERMFSRYDNMMQHTQTHNKSRGTLRRIKTKTPSKKMRGNGKKASFSSQRGSSSDEYSDDFGPLPSPPPSRRGSSRDLSSALDNNTKVKYNHHMLVDDDDDDDDDMMDSGDDEYRPPTSSYYNHYHQQHQQRPLSPPHHHQHLQHYPPPLQPSSYHQQQYYHHQQPYRYEGRYPPSAINTTPIATLPPSRCPDSPISSESSGSRSDHTTEVVKHRRRSMPQVYYHPYPYQQHSEKQSLVPILPRRQESVLPQLACYLVNHPNALPESYFQPPKEEPKIHRRLSLQDLSNPIESLKDSSEENEEEEVGIDLTEDEFQAIQGFGQFYRAAVTCTK